MAGNGTRQVYLEHGPLDNEIAEIPKEDTRYITYTEPQQHIYEESTQRLVMGSWKMKIFKYAGTIELLDIANAKSV